MKYRIISNTRLGKDVFMIQYEKHPWSRWRTMTTCDREGKHDPIECSTLKDAIIEVDKCETASEDDKRPWKVVWESWIVLGMIKSNRKR